MDSAKVSAKRVILLLLFDDGSTFVTLVFIYMIYVKYVHKDTQTQLVLY